MRLNLHCPTFEPVVPFRVPHLTKHKQMRETATESFVFAMVWEAIETLGFRDILERLAGLSPKVFLDRSFRVCEADPQPPRAPKIKKER